MFRNPFVLVISIIIIRPLVDRPQGRSNTQSNKNIDLLCPEPHAAKAAAMAFAALPVSATACAGRLGRLRALRTGEDARKNNKL
ncbi:hypothetical protein ACMAUO_03305 [Gluconacetobacter sp. Hr-1-5]|uniref:hypothetical protein n=1 Tax=Gluconacetobacter sp. Hr-1-5 TaxID=3395370 RepID=UPI003B523C21